MFRILVLVGALAAGGVAAWLSFGLQPDPVPAATVAAPEPQIRTEEVLVAAADLKQGAALTGEQLRWKEWPADAVNPKYILRSARSEAVEEFTGKVVRQAMLDGDPIYASRLADSGDLAFVLKPGKRAIAVRVSAETTAGGFVLPGNHVDVLQTGGSGGGPSHTILTNVKVLAIDQKTADSGTGTNGEDSGSGSGNTAVGNTATLELDPAQAEVISGAQASGPLSLVLRATADNEEPGLEFTRRGPGITVRIVRSGESQTVQTDGVAR